MSNSIAPKTAATPIGDLPSHVGNLYHQTFDWLIVNWVEALIAVGIGILIFLALHFAKSLGNRLCRRDATGKGWYTIFGRAIARTGNFFMAMLAAELVVTGAAASHPPETLVAAIRFLFTVAAVFQGAIWAREIILGAIEHRTAASEDHSETLTNAMGLIRLFVTFALFAIALIMVLGNLGVNVSGLIAGLGVGGIAIGLAAQGIFADLFAALAIIFDRPFSRGDQVSYGDSSGTIEAIGLKSTRIRAYTGELRIIANKKLLDYDILNVTRRLRNRFKYDFFLGYATPPDVVRKVPTILREAVESEGYTLVHGGLNGFAPNGLSYDVEFESIESDFPPEARDRVAAAILARFRDNDISFAYPTQLNLIAEKTKPNPPARADNEDEAEEAKKE